MKFTASVFMFTKIQLPKLKFIKICHSILFADNRRITLTEKQQHLDIKNSTLVCIKAKNLRYTKHYKCIFKYQVKCILVITFD